jgi:hypothetical protein
MLDSSGASILCSAVALLMLALTTLGIPLDGGSGKQTALKYLWPHYLVGLLVLALLFFAYHLQPVTIAIFFLLLCLAQAALAQRKTVFSRLTVDSPAI